MAKQVILAVAGAGKTYHICHSIDPKKKNLILAFTHENINNIQKELCHAFGKVPQCTTISTFDAFVYRELILPYVLPILNINQKTSLRIILHQRSNIIAPIFLN